MVRDYDTEPFQFFYNGKMYAFHERYGVWEYNERLDYLSINEVLRKFGKKTKYEIKLEFDLDVRRVDTWVDYFMLTYKDYRDEVESSW